MQGLASHEEAKSYFGTVLLAAPLLFLNIVEKIYFALALTQRNSTY